MIFCINNKIRNASITVNGADELYPVSNLYSDQLYLTTVFTNWIVFDLGSAILIDTIAAINASGTITVEANSSDSWGAPPYSITLNTVSSNGVSIEFISQTYRYWRLNISGPSTLQHFYLGQKYTLPDPENALAIGKQTNDVQAISGSGQIYSTQGIDQNITSINVPVARFTEKEIFRNFCESDQRRRSFVFAKTEFNLIKWLPFYAKIIDDPEIGPEISPGKYRFSFNLLEAK